MTETKVKINSIVESQLPQYVREEFPLLPEFLSQYYISLESQGNVSDLLQNIDQYIKVDNLTNLVESTKLTSDIDFFDLTINAESTAGFPDSYGFLLIDSEIITYTSKTPTTFEGCIRGFNGVTSFNDKIDELTFNETESQQHFVSIDGTDTIVKNLSVLFLKEFLSKIKKQFIPGFENREFYSGLNENVFIKQAKDFYSSKGTDRSFKILFGALYGENVDVIRPRDYLIEPSNAQYRVTSDLVVEVIEGNPEELVNSTLYQDKFSFGGEEFIEESRGTITKIEKIRRGDRNYYRISIDSDYDKDIVPKGTVFGSFSIHPKTKVVTSLPVGSTTLEVDSTVSFPNKDGVLLIDLDNGTSLSVTYSSKTLNQFLGCSGIDQDIERGTEINLDSYSYGYGKSGIVKIRVLGVLSDVILPEDANLYEKNSEITIKSLGSDLDNQKTKNWLFNSPLRYNVSNISLLDSSNRSYKITTYDDHSFRVGDLLSLITSSSDTIVGIVYFIGSKKSLNIKFGQENLLLDLNSTYSIEKNILKASFANSSSTNQYTTNIQNVYIDNEDLYIASPSIPTYSDLSTGSIINIVANDRSIVFDGTFSPDNDNDLTEGTTLDIGFEHGLYTGDSIVYKPSFEEIIDDEGNVILNPNNLGISSGIYFIKKISPTKIKLSRSRSNIFTNNFVSIATTTVTNCKFELRDFTYRDLNTQVLDSQKLIRKISTPENTDKIQETLPGSTGIFINGVELLNYKSKDNIFYGPIENIISKVSGSGYDIINPPNLTILDSVGSGCVAHCSVVGGLERVDIIDPGFDYLEDPIITIVGGNGSGAIAKPRLISYDYEIQFNSENSSDLVELNPYNIIGFSTYHKFRDNEEVIYITSEQNAIGGISTNSTYYVSVQDLFKVKLHKSLSDSVAGINTIQLTSYGSGTHILRSKNKKRKIGSIDIENSGDNYQSKLTVLNSAGVSTSTEVIRISGHGYKSGEIITYNATETPIGGLSSASSYYVTKIDDDHFKLSKVGVSTLGFSSSYYYETNQYITITNEGSGKHKFNYPNINLTVSGKIGVSTISNVDYNAVLNPIFRGEIQSVFVEEGGSKYGSEEIINYNRQPEFELNSGSGIQLKPIISNGQISSIIINSPGSGYISIPDIIVNGDGFGATLVPFFSNGSLTEVKVISGGNGYSQSNTTIDVISPGSGAKFEATIKSWKINLVDRLLKNNQIGNDDGILSSGLNSDYGIQYTHAYAPRPLRSIVLGTSFKDGEKTYSLDLKIEENIEADSNAHSPIIGWSYDGHPIYGPYGYSSNSGGSIKVLKSGYQKIIKADRPGGLSQSLYPYGFFVEDYEYTNNGDLDVHNGRFCVTPEYPNGIYAYFTTIEQQVTSGKYKQPVFPYAIGNSYKSNPIEFNFETSSNQDYIDINQTSWKRNTSYYNYNKENSFYDYFPNQDLKNNQNLKVKNTLKAGVDFIGIETGGNNYKVGDRIIFDGSGSSRANAKISLIEGTPVSQISVATSTLSNVEFYPYNQQFVGFATFPHDYSDNDLVTFTGNYDYKKSGTIKVSNSNLLTLTAGVRSEYHTGIVTYFSVSGTLSYPTIKENDIYQIGNEQVKILNVDPESSRIRVLRNQNNTVGIESYSSGIGLTEQSRKFYLNFGISTSYNSKQNKEFYFSPEEVVAIGTGVTTNVFSNPGAGITQITIPTQTIYLKNHNLNTGDSLIYSSNGGSAISVSTDGSSSFNLEENSIVYAAKISKDLIGISTIRVGLGSTGNYVNSESTVGLLYFTSIGLGNTHSFKTNYENTLKGEISKNIVTVSTSSTHGLSPLDNVIISANSGVSTTVIVKYSDSTRRLLINPKYFSSINIEKNIINLPNHNLYNGQKVLHSSDTPASGLETEKIYYVTTIDSNSIKLSNSYYDAVKNNPNNIEITSSSFGYISEINPNINLIKNQTVIFDLSDISLAFSDGGTLYSAFELKFYEDNNFEHEFLSTKTSSSFEVSRSGRVGIDSTSKVTLEISKNIPNNLYYNLQPINIDKNNPKVKRDIIVDNEVLGYNKLSIKNSVYNGEHIVTGVSSNTFSYNILEIPESPSYSSNIEYYTGSNTAKGSIYEISILNGGKYSTLPGIVTIISQDGSDALLFPSSKNIGKISSIDIEDIGYNYSSDYSIRPTAKLAEIITLEPYSSLDYIGISSSGKNYIIPPSLILVDSITNKVVEGVKLEYNIGDKNVSIVKNSQYINSTTPKIIPINNTNGFKIRNISFNDITKEVTVELNKEFSDLGDFPFEIGTKIIVEGVSVGVGSTGKNYNSSQYNYELFTLTNVNADLGGSNASVTYNLSSYLNNAEVPGDFDAPNSSGIIVPDSYFPIFNPILKKNNFYDGEIIVNSTNSTSGKVLSWDNKNSILKVSTKNEFKIGDIILGNSSGSIGKIKSKKSFEVDCVVGSSSIVKSGWNRETGFLNNTFQRIHDSDYYQYFSYDLKSKKELSSWGDDVNALNHTAGFKKFGNLIVETSSDFGSGISTDQNKGDFSATVDFSSIMNTNCVHDFDLAKENNLTIDNELKSNEIIFNSRIIQDYVESIGNRVLLIDNISDQFNSTPRSTSFSVVDTFNLTDFRSKKYVISIQDKFYSHEHQLSLVSLIHNDTYSFINQYGIYSDINLGFFDFNVLGVDGNLTFYPTKADYNDYYLELFSFNINDVTSGIGSTSLGDSVKIYTQSNIIPESTSSATTIVGIASTYRSSKILVQIGSSVSSYYEYDEITYIHDGNNVSILDYGQITTDSYGPYSTSGIGTYDAYISAGEVKIDLIPYSETESEYVINSMIISLSDSNSVGIGTQVLSGSSIDSSSTQILSSPTPTPTIISKYLNEDYTSAYLVVSIEDKTNLNYQVSELLVISTYNVSTGQTNTYITQYGDITTGSEVGIITAGVSGTETLIYFTPEPNIEVDIKAFKVSVGLESDSEQISFTNGSINYDYGTYEGRFGDLKKSFELNHKNLPIFKREFDASDSNVINITDNTILIPNHFYTTGEEVEYLPPIGESAYSVGIGTTFVSGIGLTDKLPSSLYIVKVDDLNVRVAASASDALREEPNLLELYSVGVGTVHTFLSKNQNKKLVLTIDNVIQSPIISLAQTSILIQDIDIFADRLYASNIDSIFSGDYIKIDEEIMKVNSVGVGSTNSIDVFRQWFGTGVSTHSSSSLIQKIYGDYNIIENTIHFSDAPYGRVPVTNPIEPDEIDYVGITASSSFSGRVFLRNGRTDSENEAYFENYIFDNISEQFNGIDTQFVLKSEGNDITGISSDNAILLINEIFQGPNSLNDYLLGENSGITTATFVGVGASTDYDVNTSTIPRGGIILSIGSTYGFGYQPLVSAGGTAIVSSAGTIQSISIGNSGSGYRSGIQTTVNVGVATSSTGTPNIEFIGTASINDGRVVSVAITNPGAGYTSSNPPIVIFDDPLSYSNIPLIYSSQSSAGVGTGAVVDIVVGQGSSVISFEIKNYGYGYKNNEILTIASGETIGIPTDSSLSFSEFQISIDRTYSDKFSGWTIGNLQIIDTIESLFNGSRKIFPIKVDGNQITIRSKKGSNIDIQSTLLVFINDILQVPGEGYIFAGGSAIEFTESPKVEDSCKILFYKGTADIDTVFVDVNETIKVGDTVTLESDDLFFDEEERLNISIVSSDIIETNLYSGQGVTENESLLRPVKWCKQTEDLFVDGSQVTKDRIIYEPYLHPSTNIIGSVGTSSTVIFVESVKTFFDSENEYIHNGTNEKPQNKIIIVSQEELTPAIGTAIVSTSGTVSSIDILSGGVGYSTSPTVIISGPIGFGTTAAQNTAMVSVSILGNEVTGVAVTFGGSGYDVDNPPNVLFESPEIKSEIIDNVSYEGDFGIVTGVATVSTGIASTGIVFDFYIPENSFLRNSDIINSPITISGIKTGYYFVLSGSNIGSGVTSLNSEENVVGVGTTFLDNIYEAVAVSIGQTDVAGIGLTYVAKVTASLSNYNGLNGIGYSGFYGNYSWGAIFASSRSNALEFTSNNTFGGISTSPSIRRFNRLKYIGYSTT